MTATTRTISFNTEKHAELLHWIDTHKQGRSEAVREAVAAHIERQTEYTLADVIHRLDDLQRLGVSVRGSADDNGDEPVEAVLALGELGL